MNGRDLKVWADVYDCVSESVGFSSVSDALHDIVGDSLDLPDDAPEAAREHQQQQIGAALDHMIGNIADALRHTRDALIEMHARGER